MEAALLEREAEQLGLHLSPAQLELFYRYYRELLAWNQRAGLTTIVEWEAVQVQHLLDSLTCALVLPARAFAAPYAVVDIGSGAGLPGIPLKVLLPHIRLLLVESVRKKAAFLRHVVAALGLSEVEVLALRAEEAGRVPTLREGCDLAVARAVAGLAILAEYGLPLLRPGGLLVAMKGRAVDEEVSAAQGAIAALGGELRQIQEVHLPGMDDPRHLVVVQKVQPTPQRFPRRTGIPAKRPLA